VLSSVAQPFSVKRSTIHILSHLKQTHATHAAKAPNAWVLSKRKFGLLDSIRKRSEVLSSQPNEAKHDAALTDAWVLGKRCDVLLVLVGQRVHGVDVLLACHVVGLDVRGEHGEGVPDV